VSGFFLPAFGANEHGKTRALHLRQPARMEFAKVPAMMDTALSKQHYLCRNSHRNVAVGANADSQNKRGWA
jgi:hypothetical protein